MARQGSTGAEVRAIQHALGLTIDGSFGAKTKAAVMDWQRANRLAIDGVVGAHTWSLLEKELLHKELLPLNRAVFFDNVRGLFQGRLNQSQVDGLNALLDAVNGCRINEAAYMLATAYHETARTMQPIEEYGGRAYFDKYDTGKLAAALGNTPEKDGDGFKYRGRGYVQLTGFINYKRAGSKLGIDLLNKPELALDAAIAARIMREGMIEGWFTGKKLNDYVGLRTANYVGARYIINGRDKAEQIAAQAVVFELALRKAKT